MNSPTAAKFTIDFNEELPVWDFFPLWWLAKHWHCDARHVFNLIESGEIKVVVDLRNKASSKTMIRVPRKSVVEFLNRRRDLKAVAENNPAYPARLKSVITANNPRPALASERSSRRSTSSAAGKLNCKGIPRDCKTDEQAMRKQHRTRGRPLKK